MNKNLARAIRAGIIPLFFFILMGLCGCSQEDTSVEVLPRKSKIPFDAEKVSPGNDLYPPILHSDEWEPPVPMPAKINSPGAEDSPFVTPGGRMFYFTFVPDVSVPPEKQLIDGVTGLYVSTLLGGEWAEPERVVLNDDLSLDG